MINLLASIMFLAQPALAATPDDVWEAAWDEQLQAAAPVQDARVLEGRWQGEVYLSPSSLLRERGLSKGERITFDIDAIGDSMAIVDVLHEWCPTGLSFGWKTLLEAKKNQLSILSGYGHFSVAAGGGRALLFYIKQLSNGEFIVRIDSTVPVEVGKSRRNYAIVKKR